MNRLARVAVTGSVVASVGIGLAALILTTSNNQPATTTALQSGNTLTCIVITSRRAAGRPILDLRAGGVLGVFYGGFHDAIAIKVEIRLAPRADPGLQGGSGGEWQPYVWLEHLDPPREGDPGVLGDGEYKLVSGPAGWARHALGERTLLAERPIGMWLARECWEWETGGAFEKGPWWAPGEPVFAFPPGETLASLWPWLDDGLVGSWVRWYAPGGGTASHWKQCEVRLVEMAETSASARFILSW